MAHAPGTWGYRRAWLKHHAPVILAGAIGLAVGALAYDFTIEVLASRIAARIAVNACSVNP